MLSVFPTSVTPSTLINDVVEDNKNVTHETSAKKDTIKKEIQFTEETLSTPTKKRNTDNNFIDADQNVPVSPLLVYQNSRIAPKLTKPYITEPSIEILRCMTPEKLSKVANFSISSEVGKVVWKDAVDLRYLNLDEIISFSRENHAITVYPNEEKKPKIGEGLNKEAIIYLYNCFSRRKTEEV